MRNKGDKAKELKSKLLNEEFMLLLSGTTDIYEQFGVAVQISQSVHLLPHERLDQFQKAVANMKSMSKSLDHKDCPEVEPGKKCLFAQSHADKKSLKETNTIRGLSVVEKGPSRAAALSVLTRRMRQEQIVRMDQDTIASTDKKLKDLIENLSEKLCEDVYTDDEREIIEKTRIVLDLPALADLLKQPGESVVKVQVTEFPKFLNAVKCIPVRSLRPPLMEAELRRQFSEYLSRLEEMTSSMSSEVLAKCDPKELLKKFFDPKNKLYKGIEMVMQALAVSSVKVSCESVLESFVSKYESHFDVRRNMSEEGANEEFEIAINGPNIAHCDSVVKEAMDDYWSAKKSSWHFHKVSVIERLQNFDLDSKVLDRLQNTPSHLPYME